MRQVDDSSWIWIKEPLVGDAPQMVYFRKKIALEGTPSGAKIKISADSRYKLFVNETLVEVGPSKGDKEIWYYDEIDITSYLKLGDNVMAVMVLRYSTKPAKGCQGIIATDWPGLYLVGNVTDDKGNTCDFSTDDSWKYHIDENLRIVPEAKGFAPLYIFEEQKADPQLVFWKSADYDDQKWSVALPYKKAQIRDAVSPGNLEKRTIPFMHRKQRSFSGIMQIICSKYNEQSWENFLSDQSPIVIAPNSEEVVEINAGEEMTGYLKLAMAGGKDAKIEILQSEAYVQGTDESTGLPIKADRLDCVNGRLEGYRDTYEAAGNGTTEAPEVYEPFWFRTFRFIRLSIKTGAQPLTLLRFDYEETGYPLWIQSQVETSDPSLSAIWDLSARTLQRCMHETYEDCPFYEQLQYAMDSRSQILYTYASAADDRLARKCMDDFHRAQRYDGMICSAYPNTKPNVIPGFSIYYILMIHDHMMYFGDKELVRYHMPAVENALYYFSSHRTEKGYVDKVGGPHRQEKFWSFIDWVPQWISGVPAATTKGSITIESLLYVYGCQKAAELAAYIGRHDLAREYEAEAKQVQESIRTYCMSQDGMIQDGPGVEEYSQHCQVFGVLTGTLSKDEGKINLEKTIHQKDQYAQCTVSMLLYLYRALEETGLYQDTNLYWDIWREMLANHMTTSAESAAYCRSECHAWGALALYELPSVILGVRPGAPGYEKVKIQPVPGYLTWAKGQAVTPKGIVKVSWKLADGQVQKEYQLPEGMMME